MSKITELKQLIVLAAHAAGSGHIPSAFSILDIVWTLYNEILQPDDRFILSKGHGCLALYAVLAEKNYFSKKDLLDFAKHGSIFGGHPDRNKVPGILASTGSLGHGLPIAVGVALAKKIKKEPGRVFCLIGDGECNEGSIWEACLLATHHKLNNLTVIIDNNRSTDKAINLGDIQSKFESFGFDCDCVNGHKSRQLFNGLKTRSELPYVLIADTVKGNGCKRMQDPSWHHRAPTDAELNSILEELECGNN
jgi:transketolase